MDNFQILKNNWMNKKISQKIIKLSKIYWNNKFKIKNKKSMIKVKQKIQMKINFRNFRSNQKGRKICQTIIKFKQTLWNNKY